MRDGDNGRVDWEEGGARLGVIMRGSRDKEEEGEEGGSWALLPMFLAARACSKHSEGQFQAGEEDRARREPQRTSPRRKIAIAALTVLNTCARAMEGGLGG